MSPAPGSSAHFGRLAERYDAVRPVDENWWEVYELVERAADLRGRRVLDVGCGTGRLSVALVERAHAKVWGVDASREMLAVAKEKAPGVAFKQAQAESLPFKDGWFERAVLWLVLHLVDRPAALAEARRDPRARRPPRDRDLPRVALRRALAQPVPAVARASRSRAVPDRGASRDRAGRGRLRRVSRHTDWTNARRSRALTRSSECASGTSPRST